MDEKTKKWAVPLIALIVGLLIGMFASQNEVIGEALGTKQIWKSKDSTTSPNIVVEAEEGSGTGGRKQFMCGNKSYFCGDQTTTTTTYTYTTPYGEVVTFREDVRVCVLITTSCDGSGQGWCHYGCSTTSS